MDPELNRYLKIQQDIMDEAVQEAIHTGAAEGKKHALIALRSALQDIPLDDIPKDLIIDVINNFIKRK